MIPEICGTKFWNAIVSWYSFRDHSFDSVPDERDSQYGPNVGQEEGNEENSHQGRW